MKFRMTTPVLVSRTIERDENSSEHNQWSSGMSGVGRDTRSEDGCVAVSPDGRRIQIPKELFLALWDFLEGRKTAGSITLQFRDGTISSLEAVAKKSFRNPGP